MTEQEWLQATDPRKMLVFLRGKASERKMRLFAVACCRRTWHLLTDERSRKAVEIAERYADSCTVEAERQTALDQLTEMRDEGVADLDFEKCAYARYTALPLRLHSAHAWEEFLAKPTAHGETDLLHDIFGNPFRPITITPAWLSWHGGLLVSMAQRMYDSRDFSDMPVLGDALEEAGCDNADILNHCRQPSEHVRGCWVIDLILSKDRSSNNL